VRGCLIAYIRCVVLLRMTSGERLFRASDGSSLKVFRDDGVRKAFVEPVNKQRKEMAGNVILYVSVSCPSRFSI
jgi:hypothetical protein